MVSLLQSSVVVLILYDVLTRCTDSSAESDEAAMAEVISELKDTLRTSTVCPVAWLPGFYAVPGRISVACLGNNTRYFPMDASSGYVAQCIKRELQDGGSNILDLCCCPGGKLMNIADHLSSDDTLVGVDVSERRMELCQALFRKKRGHLYSTTGTTKSARVMLYLADGTTFGPSAPGRLVFDTTVSIATDEVVGSRKRRNKSCKGRELKLLRLIETSSIRKEESDDNSVPLTRFDVVFVDAECSHDGSFRHLSECERSDRTAGGTGLSSEEAASDDKKSDVDASGGRYTKKMASSKYVARSEEEISELQKKLISNGFSLVRPGGALIYSTCSLSSRQNEEVVSHLLEQAGENAVLDCLWPSGGSTTAVTDSEATMHLQEILRMGDDALLEFLNCDRSEENANRLSSSMCEYVASMGAAPCFESSTLPGTVLFNRLGGTSGLFVSRIKKTGT